MQKFFIQSIHGCIVTTTILCHPMYLRMCNKRLFPWIYNYTVVIPTFLYRWYTLTMLLAKLAKHISWVKTCILIQLPGNDLTMPTTFLTLGSNFDVTRMHVLFLPLVFSTIQIPISWVENIKSHTSRALAY
jgi:hypothetical protein